MSCSALADAVLELDVALRPEIEEEDHHDGGEDDGGTPGILGPAARHADAGLGPYLAVRWIQKMDKGGSDDDAGAEVASEEVDVEGDMETGDAFGDDGEEGCAGGDDHDDEEGGDAGTELAIVFVGGGGDGADDIARVGGCEVDIGGVEVCGSEFVGRHCSRVWWWWWWLGGLTGFCGFLSPLFSLLFPFFRGRNVGI